MPHLPKVLLACLAGLASCGGGGGSGGGSGTNAWTGTITVSSPIPAGTTTCIGTPEIVTFTAGGANRQAVTVAGGGCVQFVSSAGGNQPAPSPVSNVCNFGIASPILTAGQSYTTAPLGAASGTQLCDWYDIQHPPTGGGH